MAKERKRKNIREKRKRGRWRWGVEGGLKENAVKEKRGVAGGKKESEEERKGEWLSVKIKKKSPSAREKMGGGGAK